MQEQLEILILKIQNLPFSTIVGNKFDGLIGEIWNDIQKSFNFEYTYEVATTFGAAPDQDGNWRGMVGMVHRKEVDLAVADFGPTLIRQQAIDFTSYFLKSRQYNNIRQFSITTTL